MYGLVYNDFVILTQETWNTRMFNSVLEEECGVTTRLLLSDEKNVPIVFNSNTKILKVVDIKPDYNSKIEWLDGPYYKISNFIANNRIKWLDGPYYEISNFIASNWIVKPLDLNIAKGNLLDKLPALRYNKEIKNIKIQVQDKIVTINTSRENRAIFATKLLSINDSEINFKFAEGWMSLKREDFQNIVSQIDQTVQDAFDWEISKSNEINACSTLEQIDLIEIYPRALEPQPMIPPGA
jgi:hypothetical protein